MFYINEYSWMKYIFYRDHCSKKNLGEGATQDFLEVSLMGESKSINELNYIVDMHCVPQEVSAGSTDLDDEGLADYMDRMNEERNLNPRMTGRVWFHTHPGNSPSPSTVDTDTFKNFFGELDFAVMFILARNGSVHCSIKYFTSFSPEKQVHQNVIPSLILSNGYEIQIPKMTAIQDAIGELKIKTDIVYPSYTKYHEQWMEEMKANVKCKQYQTHIGASYHGHYGGHNTMANTVNTHVSKPTVVQYTKQQFVANEQDKIEKLIELLIDYNLKFFSEVTEPIKNRFCSQNAIKHTEFDILTNKIMTQTEVDIEHEDIAGFQQAFDLITGDNKNNLCNLSKDDLKCVCGVMQIRPNILSGRIDKYLADTASGK